MRKKLFSYSAPPNPQSHLPSPTSSHCHGGLDRQSNHAMLNSKHQCVPVTTHWYARPSCNSSCSSWPKMVSYSLEFLAPSLLLMLCRLCGPQKLDGLIAPWCQLCGKSPVKDRMHTSTPHPQASTSLGQIHKLVSDFYRSPHHGDSQSLWEEPCQGSHAHIDTTPPSFQ